MCGGMGQAEALAWKQLLKAAAHLASSTAKGAVTTSGVEAAGGQMEPDTQHCPALAHTEGMPQLGPGAVLWSPRPHPFALQSRVKGSQGKREQGERQGRPAPYLAGPLHRGKGDCRLGRGNIPALCSQPCLGLQRGPTLNLPLPLTYSSMILGLCTRADEGSGPRGS